MLSRSNPYLVENIQYLWGLQQCGPTAAPRYVAGPGFYMNSVFANLSSSIQTTNFILVKTHVKGIFGQRFCECTRNYFEFGQIFLEALNSLIFNNTDFDNLYFLKIGLTILL